MLPGPACRGLFFILLIEIKKEDNEWFVITQTSRFVNLHYVPPEYIGTLYIMQHNKRATVGAAVGCACLVLLFGAIVERVHAEHNDWRDHWERTDEGSDIDEDDVREWRRHSSAIRDAIDELDDDPVEYLTIPVLFGVSVDDLIPNFGDPRDGGAREHKGLDMLAPEGAPVVSPTDAVVIRIGDGSSSGIYVTTANPGGESFVYMHLAEAADIEEGDVLDAGELIGFVGDTGNAVGGPAHLHFEVREDREAMDPLPRLTREYSLKEKMEFLEEILRDVDDEEEFAEFLVEEYLGVFVQARMEKIALPDEIEEALPERVTNKRDTIPSVDLSRGDEGADVVALQSILIAEGHLDIIAPTGYFGTLTEAALQTYQRERDIEPASGYYGPITRSHMDGRETSNSDEEMTRAELVERIADLTELVAQLQALLAEKQST